MLHQLGKVDNNKRKNKQHSYNKCNYDQWIFFLGFTLLCNHSLSPFDFGFYLSIMMYYTCLPSLTLLSAAFCGSSGLTSRRISLTNARLLNRATQTHFSMQMKREKKKVTK